MTSDDQPDRFVKLDEVKRRVGLGKSMIYQLIQEGKFPAPYKLSSFASRWSDREIKKAQLGSLGGLLLLLLLFKLYSKQF